MGESAPVNGTPANQGTPDARAVDLDVLTALLRDATPGPWFLGDPGDDWVWIGDREEKRRLDALGENATRREWEAWDETAAVVFANADGRRADMELVIALRNAAEYLIETARRQAEHEGAPGTETARPA